MTPAEHSPFLSTLQSLLGEDDRAGVLAFWQDRFRTYDGATEPLIQTARYWISRGNPELALEYLQKAKDLGHHAEEIILVQAHAKRRLGEPEESLDMLFQISKGVEEPETILLGLASTFCDLRMKAEAQAKLTPILFRKNESPEAKLVFGKWFYISGHYVKALNLAIQAMTSPQWRLEAGCLAAFASEKLGQTGRLRSLLAKLRHNYPQDPEVLALVALWGDQEPEWEPVMELFPRHILLLSARAWQGIRAQDWEEARRRLYVAIDRAEWHEWVQEAHLAYAYGKDKEQMDWTFFAELCESGKYPGMFEAFIRLRRTFRYNPELAKEYLDGALAQAPESPGVIRLAAEQSIVEGNLKTAMSQWLQLVKMSPWNPEGWYQIGLEYQRQERWKDAWGAFEKALEADSMHPAANLAYAEILFQAEKYEDALGFAEKFIALSPDSGEGKQWVARIKAAMGLGGDAWELAWKAWYLSGGEDSFVREQLRIMAVEPGQLAEYWVRLGKWAEAAEVIGELTDPGPAENLWGARALAGLGEYRLAWNRALEALSAQPQWAEAQATVMWLSWVLGRKKLWHDWLPVVAATDPSVAMVLNLAGVPVEVEIENPSSVAEMWLKGAQTPEIFYAEGVEWLEKCIRIEPWRGEVTGSLAILLERWGGNPGRLEKLIQGIWSDRQPMAAFVYGSWLVGNKGREAEGIRLLAMTMEEVPEHYGAGLVLARAWIGAYRISPALGVLAEMREGNEDNDVFWEIYGLAYHSQAKMDPAEKAFRTAIELNPANLVAQYGLAKVILDKKEYEAAAAQFLTVSGLEGLDAEMHFGCAQAFLLLDLPEKAIAHARAALALLTAAEGEGLGLLDKVEHFLEKLETVS